MDIIRTTTELAASGAPASDPGEDGEIKQDGTVISQKNTAKSALDNGSTANTKVIAIADLTIEYVATTGFQYQPWNNNAYIQQLPNPIDDLMRDFGVSLYDDDMMRDPQVYSTLSILVAAILCQGMTLQPALPKDDPDYEASVRVRDFCQYNLDNLRHSWPDILFELVEGMLKMGHKTAELIYEMREVPVEDPTVKQSSAPADASTGSETPAIRQGKARIVLCDVKPKAHNATAFVVNAFNDVLGLLYVKPGRPMGSIASPADVQKQLVPRAKFVIPTHRPRNGDPRGTSHLKAVYTPWWKKQQWIPQHLAYVARFAQPSIWAKLPPTVKDIPLADSGNTAITGYKSAVKATSDALAQIKGGAVAAFVDTDVEMLEATSDGQVLFNSFDLEDRQIAKGILWQTLTTEEGQHMARAASAIHQDVFGILISFLRSVVIWTVRYDMLWKSVRYNFGTDAADRLTPLVSLGDAQTVDIPKLMGGIAQLSLANGIHDSQWPKIWPIINLPPADMEAWQADQELRKQQREASTEQAKKAATADIVAPKPPASTTPSSGARPTPKPAPRPAPKPTGAPK